MASEDRPWTRARITSAASLVAAGEEQQGPLPPLYPRLCLWLRLRAGEDDACDPARGSCGDVRDDWQQPSRSTAYQMAVALCRRRPVEDRVRPVMPTLQGQKKPLVLVLDLDLTLLHSARIRDLTCGETYLLRRARARRPPTQQPAPSTEAAAAGGGEGGDGGMPLLFDLERELGLLTKLRPLVHTFLREASTMYHLCICTLGKRPYADAMARILDPDGVYFLPGDILSRSEFKERGKKGLDVVRPGDERTTVIVDDSLAVWSKHIENLIYVPQYHYFAYNSRNYGCLERSLAELREDEDETTGELAAALHLLRRIHSSFVNPRSSSKDVRQILRDATARTR